MQFLLQTLLASVPLSLLWVVVYRTSIYHRLRSAEAHLVLDRSTNSLNILDIVLVILLLAVENAKRLVGLGPKKLRRRHEASTMKKRVPPELDMFEFPDVSMTMKLEISLKDIKQYEEAVGVRDDPLRSVSDASSSLISGNNAHLALFLAAISGPAILLLLARPICPVNPLGAVNVRNSISILEPERCRQLVQQVLMKNEKSSDHRLIVRAVPRPVARRVKRGLEIDIRAVIILYESHKDTGGIEIFEQVFTVLEFGKSNSTASEDGNRAKSKLSSTHMASSSLIDVPKKELREAPQLASYFKIKLHDPIQWARLCKDYNPIHTSSIAAKMFGFRSKIAHGNHAVAKGIHILSQARDAKFLRFCSQRSDHKLWMQIEFKRPILLPAEIGVRTTNGMVDVTRGHEQYTAFEIFKSDKIHAEAAFGALTS